eukprot:6020406-Amphidinium_carterae.1
MEYPWVDLCGRGDKCVQYVRIRERTTPHVHQPEEMEKRSTLTTYHPTVLDYRPVEDIFELIH